MLNRIEKHVATYPRQYLGLVLGLIITPLIIHTVSVKFNQTFAQNLGNMMSVDPISGSIIILGVFLAILYCKQQKIKGLYVHALLQLIGVIGLLGFRHIHFTVGVLYAFLLLVITSYQNRGSKELKTSVIYSVVFFGLPFVLMYRAREMMYRDSIQDPINVWLTTILPTANSERVFMAALAVSVVALIWSNAWTKRHSVLIYLFSAACLVFVWFNIVLGLAVKGLNLSL